MPNATHNSFWIQSRPLSQRFETLSANIETEILIIGAGITGLSIALELAARGRRVVVCEAENIGAGTTGGSSGHLDAHPEMGPSNLISSLGDELAKEYVSARAATPAYQSYVLAARVKEVIPDALFWDSSKPYYYVRRARSDDEHLILVGGCDHRTVAGNEGLSRSELDTWLHDRFEVLEIVSRWSAELFEPTDGLPMIGKAFGDNMWIVTGLSGVGLTLGTASTKWIFDPLDGRSTLLTDALSPSRFGMNRPLQWLKDQAITAVESAKRIVPASRIEASSLQPGEGATGLIDGKRVAICRDSTGCEYRHSPLCTHMGGLVQWNEVEQTWDCPVHGGRFNATGKRIYGPPEEGLNQACS